MPEKKGNVRKWQDIESTKVCCELYLTDTLSGEIKVDVMQLFVFSRHAHSH